MKSYAFAPCRVFICGTLLPIFSCKGYNSPRSAIDEFQSLAKLGRDVSVGRRRFSHRTRVVVAEHRRCSIHAKGRPDDLAGVHRRPIERASEEAFDAKDAVPVTCPSLPPISLPNRA